MNIQKVRELVSMDSKLSMKAYLIIGTMLFALFLGQEI